jgi:UDP-N-acetylmuramate dehydrogenase
MEIIEDRKQRRLMAQPLEYPSAGSVFRNPENDFAGHLIEECGLKGKKLVEQWLVQNMLILLLMYGGATADDVRQLIEMVKEDSIKRSIMLN